MSIVDFKTLAPEVHHYLPADERIIQGTPNQSVAEYYQSPCSQFQCGRWSGEVGQWRVVYTEHEYCEILKGVSVITEEGGASKTVQAGDRFVIPAGFIGTWEVIEPCEKIYVMFEAK